MRIGEKSHNFFEAKPDNLIHVVSAKVPRELSKRQIVLFIFAAELTHGDFSLLQ